MSVTAEISVHVRHPSGAFQRIIEINRLTQNKGRAATPELDEVNTYEVLLRAHPDAEPRKVGKFDHVYGHDLLTLLSEAIDALGGAETPDNTIRFRGKDAR